MRLLMLLATAFWGFVFLLAARLMALAQSPPAAYAAAALGIAAIGALCMSLLIIWLTAG
jgi:hypothetical protein